MATTQHTPNHLATPTKKTLPSNVPPRRQPPRLSLPFDQRLLLTLSLSSLLGFTLGSTTAGRSASLRFRAENAHRLPHTQPGWYLYHKSKNYYKWRFGATEGARKAGMLAAWTSVFFVVEESLDVFRGTWIAGRTMDEMEGVDELDIGRVERGVGRCRDFWSSAGAGMFPVSVAARTIKMGVVVGMGYGLWQDGMRWARGRGARNRMVHEVYGEGREGEGEGV
ncbi:hypothetical protein GQ44DRAFT_752061 [Phaeosphaeriaceae sp. PMI808]|nr:hypothetical protein GQ44DRAFT_752061 [Phaeosphaeriaceae sp. PMI808]